MATTTRAMKRKPSITRQRSVRRTHTTSRREEALGSRPLLQQRRQPSIHQPPRRAGRNVVFKIPGPRRQLSVPQPAPALRSATARKVSLPHRQPSIPVKQQPARLQSPERPISPPPLKRNTRSARRAPTIRRGASLAWDARPGPPPADPEVVARIIFGERDLPGFMQNMSQLDRRALRNASKVGEFPHEFSASMLAWAGVIGRAKPPGMDIEYFIARLLKRTRNDKRPVSDQQLCFDSLDFVKELLHGSNEKILEISAKYEKERIARKRLERLLKRSPTTAPLQDLDEDATQLLGPQQADAGGQDDPSNAYPNIEEASIVAAQPVKQNIPVICYLLLRHSRALHTQLSDQNISPTRLSACIITTTKLITDVVESTTFHSPTHFSKAEFRQTFKVASSVFGICLRGLSHLCRDISGRKQKGRVIFQLCSVFKAALKWNEEMCQKVAKEAYDIARDDLVPAKRRVLSDLEQQEVEVPYLLSCRTEFLAAVFLSKELAAMPRPKCYTEVLEGISAELYTKVGTLVSETVFKEQVAASHLPGHISIISPGERTDVVKDLAVAIERGQILKLLCVVIKRLSSTTVDAAEHSPAHHLAQLISTEELLTGSEGNHGRLFKIAKEKLQHTLCKAVFGDDEGRFGKALRGLGWEDEWVDGEVGEVDVVINDEGGKFVEGVWEMVGWGILEGI